MHTDNIGKGFKAKWISRDETIGWLSPASEPSFGSHGGRSNMEGQQNILLFSPSFVSNSLWSHGLYPTRLLCPWDFPGKNTGVGNNFLLQGIFPTQGLNLHPLHWQADTLPLSYQGSPVGYLLPCNSRILIFKSFLFWLAMWFGQEIHWVSVASKVEIIFLHVWKQAARADDLLRSVPILRSCIVIFPLWFPFPFYGSFIHEFI